MAIFDLFSKRQKRLRGEVPEVYTYDAVPRVLRVQIVHIIRDAIGEDSYHGHEATRIYSLINDTLCREYGVFTLIEYPPSVEQAVFNFFLSLESVDRALDVIELSFRAIDIVGRKDGGGVNRKLSPDEAIAELNGRFREHAVGFQFESGELLRVDSEYIHAEAVKPVLALLHAAGYEGANDEFLKAHEHYRHGRYKECLVDALKAFESTLKEICRKRRWEVQPTATAKALIATCLKEGLFPFFLENQLNAIRALLESGLPTVRNKLGGHGQGPETIVVPEFLARYALNLAASNILLAVEADAAKR